MDEDNISENYSCPQCGVQVKPSDNFCFNCGAALKPQLPSTTVTSQIILYAKSIFIPPFGIYWALPYLKQSERKYKIIAIVAILLTIASLIYAIIATKNLLETVDRELEKQLNTTLYY